MKATFKRVVRESSQMELPHQGFPFMEQIKTLGLNDNNIKLSVAKATFEYKIPISTKINVNLISTYIADEGTWSDQKG